MSDVCESLSSSSSSSSNFFLDFCEHNESLKCDRLKFQKDRKKPESCHPFHPEVYSHCLYANVNDRGRHLFFLKKQSNVFLLKSCIALAMIISSALRAENPIRFVFLFKPGANFYFYSIPFMVIYLLLWRSTVHFTSSMRLFNTNTVFYGLYVVPSD